MEPHFVHQVSLLNQGLEDSLAIKNKNIAPHTDPLCFNTGPPLHAWSELHPSMPTAQGGRRVQCAMQWVNSVGYFHIVYISGFA